MRFDPNDTSNNIEDARGSGGRMGGGGTRIGIGTMVLAAVAYFVFGISPSTTIGTVEAISGAGGALNPSANTQKPSGVPPKDREGQFVSNVLRSTETVWGQIFNEHNSQYKPPKLKLFTGYVQSACGAAQSASGPFYCPGDHKVYLDTSFFREMDTRMGAGGDFAHAYVIAHEVAHHVQTLTGIEAKVSKARRTATEAQANLLSVRMELQADCYAGVWAHRANKTQKILEDGDIEEGLNAAFRIGDDYLQRKHQGVIVPDSFTHGSSEQRVRWFKTGFQSGDVNSCNTFAEKI